MEPDTKQEIGNLDILPPEMVLEFLMKIDNLKDLSSWCQTSQKAREICKDHSFWHRKYRKDYGEATLIDGDSWEKRYKRRISFGENSHISAGVYSYGWINPTGYLYMSGRRTLLGISPVTEPWFRGVHATTTSKQYLAALPPIPREEEEDTGPQVLSPSVGAIHISVSDVFVGVVTVNGKAYIWGHNINNRFGLPDEIAVMKTPMEIILPKGTRAIKIEVGRLGYAILFEDFSVLINMYKKDRININGIQGSHGPVKLKAIDVFVGDDLYSIVTKNNEVLVGGDVFQGRSDALLSYVHLVFSKPVVRCIFDRRFIMALSTTGEVYVWDYGGDIRAASEMRTVETIDSELIVLPESIIQISLADETFVAVSKTGKMYAWGRNSNNKFGSSVQVDINRPQQLSFKLPIKYVSLGWNFMVAVANDGKLYYMGSGQAPEGHMYLIPRIT